MLLQKVHVDGSWLGHPVLLHLYMTLNVAVRILVNVYGETASA